MRLRASDINKIIVVCAGCTMLMVIMCGVIFMAIKDVEFAHALLKNIGVGQGVIIIAMSVVSFNLVKLGFSSK